MPKATEPEVVWRGPAKLTELLVPIDTLHPHPENPRRGDVEAIALSVTTHGQNRALLALLDGTILAGNHTWQAIKSLGWTHVAVVQEDYPPAQAKRILLADNKAADAGEYDTDVLLELLTELQATDDGLAGTLWSDDALEQMLRDAAPPEKEERGDRLAIADVTRALPRTDTPKGSVWRLTHGERTHLLVVGDVGTPAQWAEHLEHVQGFAPYPTPHAPFSVKAQGQDYLFVTSLTMHAGYLVDAWVDQYGPDSVEQVSS